MLIKYQANYSSLQELQIWYVSIYLLQSVALFILEPTQKCKISLESNLSMAGFLTLFIWNPQVK